MTHSWTNSFGLTVCKKCGVVRSDKSQNRPCRGQLPKEPVEAVRCFHQDGEWWLITKEVKEEIDAAKFKEMTGEDPENDDLDRCNCSQAGQPGHLLCGVCEHNRPTFACHLCALKRIKGG